MPLRWPPHHQEPPLHPQAGRGAAPSNSAIRSPHGCCLRLPHHRSCSSRGEAHHPLHADEGRHSIGVSCLSHACYCHLTRTSRFGGGERREGNQAGEGSRPPRPPLPICGLNLLFLPRHAHLCRTASRDTGQGRHHHHGSGDFEHRRRGNDRCTRYRRARVPGTQAGGRLRRDDLAGLFRAVHLLRHSRARWRSCSQGGAGRLHATYAISSVFCLLPSWPVQRVLELAPASWRRTLEVPGVREQLEAGLPPGRARRPPSSARE